MVSIVSFCGENGGENVSGIQAVEPPRAQETAGEKNGYVVQIQPTEARHLVPLHSLIGLGC